MHNPAHTRIQVHDFSGHPFQAELSRELARRGFSVDHVYSSQYASGKGRLERTAGDPESLTFTPLTTGAGFDKYSALRRVRFEYAYADAWKAHVRASTPDCLIVCNVPLLALNSFRAWAHGIKEPWVLWHQDIFSIAMGDELARRFPAPIAALGRRYFTRMESRAVRSAARVIAIGDEFTRIYRGWGIDTFGVEVISNWAPIDEILPVERDNVWARAHLHRSDLHGPDRFRLVYAGTLGRKHNPGLLLDLLDGMRAGGHDAELVVVSEGDGADEIRARVRGRDDEAVTVLPFQPVEDLSEVLGSADVLVAILEPGAALFSIPSKVLTYLAAGRPILGLMPADNPAAHDIQAVDGFVDSPDAAGVQAAIDWLGTLATSPELRARAGYEARALAEEKFGIGPITDRFVAVIDEAMRPVGA